MPTGFNTQQGQGKYYLQFETTNKEYFLFMQEMARRCVDGEPPMRDEVHGHWIGEADGYADGELVYDVWYCSECNFCIDDGTDDPELLPNYCENCGAHRAKEVAHDR